MARRLEKNPDGTALLKGAKGGTGLGRRWKESLAFQLGGDDFALWGAYAAATAYARATQGIVFDPQTGEVMQPDRAAVITRDLERHLPQNPTKP